MISIPVVALLLASSALAAPTAKPCTFIARPNPLKYSSEFKQVNSDTFVSKDVVKGGATLAISAYFSDESGLTLTPGDAHSNPVKLAVFYDTDNGEGVDFIQTLKGESCYVKDSLAWIEVGGVSVVAVSDELEKRATVPKCQVTSKTANDVKDRFRSFSSPSINEYLSNIEVEYAAGSTAPSVKGEFVPEHGLTITTALAFTETPKLAIKHIGHTDEDEYGVEYVIPAREGACRVAGSEKWDYVTGMSFLTSTK